MVELATGEAAGTGDDTADTTGAGTDTGTDQGGGGQGAGEGAAAGADQSGAGDGTNDDAKDWRAEMAGEDPKLLGYLGRFASPKALVEAVKRHNDDIKGGKYLKPLSDEPTDEELANYRKANSIPEKPDGYFETLGDGLVVGEDDKPFVSQFLESMHATNAPPAMVNAALGTYYKIVESQAADHAEAVAANKQTNDDALREEWGADYRRNINVADSFLATLPAEVSAELVGGTDSKGMPLGANASVIKWITGLALEANPLATVVPGAGANQASAIGDEIAKIEKVMATDRKAYNADEKMQARLRELYAAREKLAEKG